MSQLLVAKQVVLLCLFDFSLMGTGISAQAGAVNGSGAAQPTEDRSFYIGKPVPRPEEISGIWEAPDGHGGAIGIHLVLDAAAPPEATTLVGTSQTWLDLQVGIYERTGAVLQFGEQNSFSDSPRGGSVKYENGRLTLDWGDFDLDLTRIAGDRWRGRVHRKAFDSVVTLARPGDGIASRKSWLMGTWKTGNGPSQTCLHIAEQAPGEFTGWSDSLITWGSGQFSPHVTRPAYSYEHYGELAKIQAVTNGGASVELYAYSAVCCSHRFLASPVENGAVIRAEWPSGPNQAPHTNEWRKMPGNSCIVPAP